MRRQCDKVRDGDLVAYLSNPDDESLRDVHAHVSGCEECTIELRAWRGLRGDLLIDDDVPCGDHPAEEALIAFGDDAASLGPVLSTEIQAHLSGCARCRDEIKVLAGVRIERAATEESLREARAVTLPVASVPIDPVRDAAVIESMTVGRRLRHPGVAFVLFLVLSVPVLGLLAIESGLMPAGEDAKLQSSSELKFDPLTLTARPTGVANREGAPEWELPQLQAAAEEADSRAVVQDFAEVLSSAEVPPQAAVQPLPKAVASVAAPEVAANRAASADESDEHLPSSSTSEARFSPEELMAMLESERRIAEMHERALVIPDAPDTTPSGAAILETMPSSVPAGAAELGAGDEMRNETTRSRSARVAPETMILGVRELGTAPVRGEMLGMSQPSDRSSRGESSPALRGGGWAKARVHFVRGSSYVFTRDEVYRGMEVRFPLPMRDGQVHGVDVRVVEVGGNRELKQSFAAPEAPLQSSPLVSLDIPAGWLSTGRYSVEVATPEAGVDSAHRINIRVLDSSARQDRPDHDATPASVPLE
jgi:hypothetical protein